VTVDYKAVDILTTPQTITDVIWRKMVDDIALHQIQQTVRGTNNTGVVLTEGDVVVFETTVDNSVIFTTTVGDTRKVGVVQDDLIDVGQQGYIVIQGHVPVIKVTGAVGRQQPLQTSATTHRAQQGAGSSFGVALTANPSGTGTIEAFIHNVGAASNPGHVIKDESATFTQRTNLKVIGGIVEDDGANDQTIVTLGFPVGPVSATHGPATFNPTTTAAFTAIVAPGGGLAIYVTSIAAWNQSATATRLDAKDGAGGTVRFSARLAGVDGGGFVHAFDPPWELTAATLMELKLSVAADVLVEVNFYVKAVSP
jgi:hypothetical protein